jgi:hypothetical protein
MTTSNIIITLLSLSSSSLIYTVWNLLKKVEIYEEDIQYKEEFIQQINTFINEQDARLQDETIRTAFESDDQIGDFFKRMKSLILGLKTYQNNYTTGQDL